MVLPQIILANVLVSLLAFVNILFVLFSRRLKDITFYLISLASGTLLGAAFLHLIPRALEHGHHQAMVLISVGIFLFFGLEKFLIWRHCHHHHKPEEHAHPVTAPMILTGDAVHNFIDGIIIASAFLEGPAVGVSVTLAIMLHEIPQEIGDFGVLIHSGYTVKRALWFNFFFGLTAILGGVLGYFFLAAMPAVQGVILPIAAGGFLYIALADLIPQLHTQPARPAWGQIALLIGGFAVILLLHGSH